MRIGAVPVPVSTMLHADGLAELLRDSRARLLAVTARVRRGRRRRRCATPRSCDASWSRRGASDRPTAVPVHSARRARGAAEPDPPSTRPPPTRPRSGSTPRARPGRRRRAMHRHGSIQVVCETYGAQVLGITRGRPLPVRGEGVLRLRPGQLAAVPAVGRRGGRSSSPAPSKPDLIVDRAQKYGATLFFAGPTFFANMLRADLPGDALAGVRLAASAGEALPAALYQRWTGHFGVDIIDGIGMTEMLHIFLSNRVGEVRPGTTGVAVPGYDLRIVDEAGHDVAAGHAGHAAGPRRVDRDRLLVALRRVAAGVPGRVAAHRRHLRAGRATATTPASAAPTTCSRPAACGCRRPRSRAGCSRTTPWRRPSSSRRSTRTGWRSRSRTSSLTAGRTAGEDELIEFCRAGLPSFKRPRRVVFVDAYPTTATGKIRRVELRGWRRRRCSPDGRSLGSRDARRTPADRRPPAPGPAARAQAALGRVGAGVRLARAARALRRRRRRSTRPRSTPTSPTRASTSRWCSPSTARRSPGTQAVEDFLPLTAHNPERIRFAANVNPHLHYPVDEELTRQLDLGAVALKVHPVHGGFAANDRALYPAYAICQDARRARWSCTAARRRSPAR